MKLCLYSITYAGMWSDGPALSIGEFIARAKRSGYPAVELDGRARNIQFGVKFNF